MCLEVTEHALESGLVTYSYTFQEQRYKQAQKVGTVVLVSIAGVTLCAISGGTIPGWLLLL